MAMEMQAAIQALRAQAEQKQRELAAVEKALGHLEQVARMVDPESMPASSEYTGLAIAEAAKRLVTELGRSASTREIAQALLKRGIRTNSKNFSMTVYTILRESPHFKRNGDGWSLRS